MAYTRSGLGAVQEAPGAPLEEALRDENTALDYIRRRWADFLALGPRIVDLQHRAALLAQRLGEAGNIEGKRQAQDVIRALGRLNVKHGEAVDRYELERIGEVVGLGAVPFVPVATVTGLALVVAWAFRAYAAEERKLELIEAGLLTPAEAASLDAGPAPGMLFGGVETIAKLAVGALALYVILEGLRVWRPNPPLEIWHTNPPGVFGEEVYDLRYRHADDGLDYVHDFGPGVELEGLDDGTVRLSHRADLPLWEEFDV